MSDFTNFCKEIRMKNMTTLSSFCLIGDEDWQYRQKVRQVPRLAYSGSADKLVKTEQ